MTILVGIEYTTKTECQCCNHVLFTPVKLGPVTLSTHRQIEIIKRIYEPIIDKQLARDALFLRSV